MALALVRIDDRLVHGQVVEGWIPHLRAEAVIVASDVAAEDATHVMLMRLALPPGIGLEVLPVSQAAGHAALEPSYPKRVLLLAPGPREVLALLEAGVAFAEVNVGGLHYTAGRVQLGRAIFLSEEDRRALRAISRRGVRLEGRALPGDAPLDLLEALGAPGGPNQ